MPNTMVAMKIINQLETFTILCQKTVLTMIHFWSLADYSEFSLSCICIGIKKIYFQILLLLCDGSNLSCTNHKFLASGIANVSVCNGKLVSHGKTFVPIAV